MWFVVVLTCAVVAAQPSDRDHWDQAGQMNEEKHFTNPPQVRGTPVRPRWRQNKFASSAFKPEQMNPWNPDGSREEQAQGAFAGSPYGRDPAVLGQNVRGNRDEWTRSRSNLNHGALKNGQMDKRGAAGEAQWSGRPDRPPFRSPVGGSVGEENQIGQLLGKPLRPDMKDNMQFLPIFKAENVTLQNASAYHLKEGENIFLLPKSREQKHPPKGGVKRPQEMGYGYSLSGPQPYVKLIYNPTATQKISFEYGITMLLPSFMKAESENN